MSYKKATVSNSTMSELNPPFKMVNAMKAKGGFVGPPNHSHSIYHLNYIFSGNLTITFKGEKYKISSGMAFVLPPDIPHSVYTETEYSQMGVDLLNESDSRGLFDLISSVCNNEFRVCKIPEPTFLFDDIHRIINTPTALNIHLAEHKAEELLLKTVEALNNKNKSDFETKFKHALKQINSTPTLDEICKLTGYSRVHIERLAKGCFGCGAIEYINRIKINRICSLLVNTDMSILEIAEKEGFYDASHLTVFFKKRMGITPSKYRK